MYHFELIIILVELFKDGKDLRLRELNPKRLFYDDLNLIW